MFEEKKEVLLFLLQASFRARGEGERGSGVCT